MKLRIKEIVQQRGMTMHELAERVNLDRTLVSRYASGRLWPRPEAWLRIAEALGVEPYQLIDGAPLDKLPDLRAA